MTSSNRKKTFQQVLVFIFVAVAILLPRIFELDRFATTDEPEWLAQSGNFYYALGQRDFAETYRREHPAVTTIWAGMAGYLAVFPEYRALGHGYVKTIEMEDFLDSQGVQALDILQAGRTFLVLGTTVILLFGFAYGRRLFGTRGALVGFLLIAFNPYHAALTRVLHIDGMLGNLMLLSALAFLVYLYKGRHWRDLAVSGVAGGLALLTKAPALFLFPFAGLALLIHWGYESKEEIAAKPSSFLKRLGLPLVMWVLIALVTLTVLWPAMWVSPLEVLDKVFVEVARYASAGHNKPIFFNGEIVETGRVGLDLFYFYPLTYLWRSTPAALLGLVALGFMLIKKLPPFDKREMRYLALSLLLFAFFYAVFMTLGTKKFDRYFLPAYLPLDLLAGVAWVGLSAWAAKKWFRNRLAPDVVMVVVVVIQLLGVWKHYPYYFSYYNPLMGGVDKAPEAMMIGWGEGLDQVGAYLNQKPDAPALTAAAGYYSGPFSYYFDGQAIRSFEVTPQMSKEEMQTFRELDYFVVYANDRQRGFADFWEPYTPEKFIEINGLDYAWIYDMKTIPRPEFIPND